VDTDISRIDTVFRSFFIAGFECATQRHSTGRLDLIAATEHDRFARQDYERLRACGFQTARDGVRWHLIEKRAGCYDFSSVLPMLRAARETNTQVIWDLCHYGWPDSVDVFSAAFVDRFARFAGAFLRLLDAESDQVPFVVPINEPSYLAWAGGEIAYFHPFARNRGSELKRQLVRASIAAIEAIRAVRRDVRIISTDPLINVIAGGCETGGGAHLYHERQYEARDMLTGVLEPALGGHPRYLDILGVNYYSFNQWVYENERSISQPFLDATHPQYRPLHDLLGEIHARYGRPLFVAETGIEGVSRPLWLRAICDELRAANARGVPVHGLCWYPILDHPGWDDGRFCAHGLWSYPDESGYRPICEPLQEELAQQHRAGFPKPGTEARG
jgi:beta-glucosidase/6-phospho-beta-glucosidase/beta-galactosidase